MPKQHSYTEFQIFHYALSKTAYSNAFGEEGRREEEKKNIIPHHSPRVFYSLSFASFCSA